MIYYIHILNGKNENETLHIYTYSIPVSYSHHRIRNRSSRTNDRPNVYMYVQN
jgi:hypothetical protein